MNDNTTNIPASNREVSSADNIPSGIALPQAIAKAENFPALVAEYIDDEYGAMRTTLAELQARLAALPAVINTDAEMGEYAKLVKDARDFNHRVEATRVAEKDNYFRGAQAIDGKFVPIRDAAARPNKTARPGVADEGSSRIDDYNQRKLAAERAKREAEARRLREEEDQKRRAQEEAQRAADEAARKAERARKDQAAKAEVALQANTQAAVATAEVSVAAQKAEQAHIDTLAKPADMVRHRVDEGPVVTMKREPYAVLEDDTKLDKEKLWAFIKRDAKEQALRAWAKNTGHTEQMAGARIGFKEVSVVR